jgi:hypothetical protein
MEPNVSYRHRVVTDQDILEIRALIDEHPQASRRELSKKLCVVWNWVQTNGTPRDMVGLGGRWRTGGSVIKPSRCSLSISPRHCSPAVASRPLPN